MKYTLDEVTEKLERACRRIDELQEKNLRLAEKNNSLIKDSIKAQEILTSQSVADEERDDLKRRLQNAELCIELMKDERYRANEKYEALYRHYKLGNDLYLAENLRAEKLQAALLNIADNAAHWDTGCGPDTSAFGWIHDTAEAALSSINNQSASQPEIPAEADGDEDSVIDDLTRQTLRMAIDDMKQTLKDCHHVSKEWADMIRQVIRLWEKKLEEAEE